MTARRDIRLNRSARLLLAASCSAASVIWPASFASAQARVGGVPAKPTAVGLDSLSEEAVMGELAGRGLNSLLNKMFDERKVPQTERDSFQSLQALRELKASGALADDKRIELLRKSVDGLNALMPKLTDPYQEAEYAATLIAKGIEPDVNILEYWGDNPIRQQRIKLATKLTTDMLNKSSADAIVQMNKIQGQIKSAKDAAKMEECEKLFNFSQTAKYTANVAVYYQALAIDVAGPNAKAALEERKKLVDPSIKYLTDEVPGPNTSVELKLGRLFMVKGDYTTAKKRFDVVIKKEGLADKSDKKPTAIDPPPTDWEQNEARYFSVVCDVLAKKVSDAEKGFKDLEAFQKTASADLKASKGTQAQNLMLSYRIIQAKADLATGPAKTKLSNEADAELDKLAAIDKGFNALVAEQRVSRVKDDTDLTTLSVPILNVLMGRGVTEWRKVENDPSFDAKVLDRGLQAAKIIMSKKVGGENGPSLTAVENASRNAAVFLERQNKTVEAAAMYLSYAENPAYQGKEAAARSMDRAVFLATQAYVKEPSNQEAIAVYDRMLAVGAAPPYSNPALFFFRANQLRAKAENVPEALKYYAMVPATDKRYYDSRYWMMVLGLQELDKVKDPANRAKKVREISDIAAQLRPLAQKALTEAKDEKAKQAAQFRLARATLTEAELALRQQPAKSKQAVAILQGFEASTTGLPQSDALIARAVFARANALMAEGQIKQAVEQVEPLAANPKTSDFAVGLVRELLDKVEADIKDARKAEAETKGSPPPAVRDLLANLLNIRATLSGLLMPFAQRQKDPQKREELVQQIIAFDANAKFEAGQALPPGPEREKRLKEAMDVFTKLLAAAQAPGVKARSTINVGKCQYELGMYMEAITSFAGLVQKQQIGTPRIQNVGVDGNVIEKDNPDYWGAIYMLNNARYLLASKNPNDVESQKLLDAARRSISPLFSIHGDNIGGESYHKEFVELKEKLMPGGAVPGAPASQPAAAAK